MKVYRKAEIDTTVLEVGDTIVLNNGASASSGVRPAFLIIQ